MIESIYFINLRNQRWDFNTNTCPLKSFEIDGETRMTDRSKAEEAGDWPGYNYLGRQLIHLAGDLIGDTSEEYITRRLSMMSIICPPEGRQRNRRWGSLYIKYYGQETLQADCTVDGYPDLPMTGQNPTVTTYTVNFKIFNPYWQGVITGNKYLI
jgi:hypothetical protein